MSEFAEPGPIPGIGATGAVWLAGGCVAEGCVGWPTLVCAAALAAMSVKPKPAINERAEVYFMS
jgi:hypothetical protein